MQTRSIAFHPGTLTLEAHVVIPDEPRALVVLCHGIPGGGPRAPDDTGYEGLAHRVAAAGTAAVWFHFRGCYGAPGEFSAGGWVQDLGALLDTLAADELFTGLPVAVVGSSMGGATAIATVAGRTDVDALATLAAPARVTDIERDPAAFLHRARNAGIIRDPAFPPDDTAWAAEFERWSALAHVASIAPRPLLLLHGDTDDVVPYADVEILFAAAREPKELVRIERGAHQLRRDARAVDALLDWLERRLDVPNVPFSTDAASS